MVSVDVKHNVYLLWYEATVQTLCESRRELEQTEPGCWEISLTNQQKRTHANACKILVSTL